MTEAQRLAGCLAASYSNDEHIVQEAAAELRRLEVENERLRVALIFYADASDYKSPFNGTKLWYDCGEKARAAIEATGAMP